MTIYANKHISQNVKLLQQWRIWCGLHNVRGLFIFRAAHIQASCSAVHHSPSCVLPLFLMIVAGWLFLFSGWPWQARRAKLGSWGGPETITVEGSSAQESSSDQLDVTHHHLFRPDKDWVCTKCTLEFRPVFFVFKLFFLFCSGSWPSIWPCVWLCIYLFLFSHCLICYFSSLIASISLSLLLSLVLFLPHPWSLSVCHHSKLHITSSLYASGPSGY